MKDIPRKRRFPRKPIIRRTPSAFSVGNRPIVWLSGTGGAGAGYAGPVERGVKDGYITIKYPSGEHFYTGGGDR